MAMRNMIKNAIATH